ncbi:MAG: cysteine desulfurase [Nitrososphaerota archaeon]|nr:cysteine desulfurase [Nitrososphaerota archaeon]MDG6979202.1 cysteine desulfurase [Nitrososphaerota archaeon]MDG7020996.1 cysteine desulfurase [Nitrososphaerota archaeon]
MLEPTKTVDVEKVRGDFPILRRTFDGKRLVYLDNAATTQKPKAVIDSLVDYYSRYNANIHRGVHQLSIEATEAHEAARKKVARFLNAGSHREVVFTRGTTESINLVRFAWGPAAVKEGDVVLLTLMEHHSNIVPWQQLAKERGARIEYVPLTPDGRLDMGEFERLLGLSPALVAFTQCSNVLGTINDAERLCSMARSAGAVTVVDGAQSAPHMAVDVRRIGCDFFAVSGHKMLGPTGIGALYGRRELLDSMGPFQTGGDMIKEVHVDGARWNDVPYKFEAGTTNIADAVGFGAAIDYLASVGMDRVRRHEVELLRYSFEKLSAIPALTVYGPADPESRGGVISFNLADIHPHDMASILDAEGVAIRSGHHCAQPLMDHLGVPGTSRASFYIYNSYDDVDAFIAALLKAKKVFSV